MKVSFFQPLSCWLRAAFVILPAFWLLGCATAGFNKSDATARSLQHASFEVNSEGRALELTMHTLGDLVNKPGADLKPQYKRFNTAMNRLIAAAHRNERADRTIAKKSSAYFEAWEKEIATMNYEVVRSRSETRKTEAINDFQSVHQRYLEVQSTMQPLLSYLEDIRSALSADLTQRGLDAMKPIVAHAEENAAKVQTALNRLSNELNESGARLSSYAFQNAPTGGTNVSSLK